MTRSAAPPRSRPARPAASRRRPSSAYQRAEAVINKADASCALPWELIAAIGRVESDHGRFGGNTLDDQGVARPGIYGIALNGKNNTQDISDTDAGQYDNDTRHDRAVGPMQFIPSTWAVVGVDGDSDGTRNPQDIDDAALATAVYLCSGDDDLSAEKGQRASVYRYNHSNDYVDLVLSIMQAYMDGDFSAVPTSTLTSGVILPDLTGSGDESGDKGGKGGRQGRKGEGRRHGGEHADLQPDPHHADAHPDHDADAHTVSDADPDADQEPDDGRADDAAHDPDAAADVADRHHHPHADVGRGPGTVPRPGHLGARRGGAQRLHRRPDEPLTPVAGRGRRASACHETPQRRSRRAASDAQ